MRVGDKETVTLAIATVGIKVNALHAILFPLDVGLACFHFLCKYRFHSWMAFSGLSPMALLYSLVFGLRIFVQEFLKSKADGGFLAGAAKILEAFQIAVKGFDGIDRHALKIRD